MCGFVALFGAAAAHGSGLSLSRLLGELTHRGPDSEGIYEDREADLALGHRRLSILDTSEAGHQPMHSPSGRYVIAYNGEIYNYRELSEELRARNSALQLKGGSDTEVLLAAIETFGLEETLKKCVGMFGFALWDRRERRLFLARDRIGKKPVYYGIVGGALVVTSELRGIPRGLLNLDRDAFALLCRFTFIPEPWTCFHEMKKLLPGTVLSLSREDLAQKELPAPRPFWSLDEAAREGKRAPARGSEAENVNELHDLLRLCVGQRLRSDVPLGAFLSGGIDSSLVVALMQTQSAQKVRTFSIGFESAAHDESKDARRVAAHLGTEHTEFRVQAEDVFKLAQQMPSIYAEPFADSSQLPTVLVSRLAAREVKVVLTGDGGDEMFAGYNRHVWGQRLWPWIQRTPGPLRNAAFGALSHASAESWDAFGTGVSRVFSSRVFSSRLRVRGLGEKVHKLSRAARAEGAEDFHLELATHWAPEENPVLGSTVPRTRAEHVPEVPGMSPLERALWFDTMLGLPGDMLVKVDRATMSVGLEARQPLLDHRLLEASWRLPENFKLRDGVGKWVLREVLSKYVPRPLWDRPKMGFSVPLDDWLRGPLKEWAGDLLSERSLTKSGLFEAERVERAWNLHQTRQANLSSKLWTVLMAEAWTREREPALHAAGEGY